MLLDIIIIAYDTQATGYQLLSIVVSCHYFGNPAKITTYTTPDSIFLFLFSPPLLPCMLEDEEMQWVERHAISPTLLSMDKMDVK